LQLVVLLGDHAARMARDAGLLTAAGFLVADRRIPATVVREVGDVGIGPEWAALGTPVKFSPVVRYPTAVEVLWGIVQGRCSGHAWKPIDGEWRRSFEKPGQELVHAHIEGRGWLSPYRPYGAWPYCVIDVDLHNAIQSRAHDDVMRRLTAQFPRSLVLRSSATWGIHLYVRLPEGMAYTDAAIWLSEYLLVNDLMFERAEPGPFATATGMVATKLVDVPLHPPRLPFGLGSGLRGTPDPAAAVERFTRWLTSADSSDFDEARTLVEQKRPRTKRWPERAAWASTFVHELELEALGMRDREKKLLAGDPWAPYMARLAPSLRVLVSRGCLAFGTRTATMMRIVDALADMVDPDEARRLLRHWVEHRDHHSEDIHGAREEVLAFGDRLIDDAFAGRGVPEAAWLHGDAQISAMFAHIKSGRARDFGLTLEECRRAVFYILRLFFAERSGNIPIAGEQFGLALRDDNFGGLPVQRPNRNRVAHVADALIRLGVIERTRPASHADHRAAEYALRPPYWPPPPTGSPIVFRPTSGSAP